MRARTRAYSGMARPHTATPARKARRSSNCPASKRKNPQGVYAHPGDLRSLTSALADAHKATRQTLSRLHAARYCAYFAPWAATAAAPAAAASGSR
ncbi:MAG TPA: hypothetical protein DEV68_07280 [Corynebacterium flavescens]|nr:hypothetical protein [Corynebacterium flavescens]